MSYHLADMWKVGGRVLMISSLLFLVVMTVKLWLDRKASSFGYTPYSNQSAHREFRKYMVWLLTLSFFANAVVLVPILYVKGYVTQLAALLPGKEQLGPKVSLSLAFAAGAIASGVLGNLSYDLLKYFYRKVRE